MTVSLSCLLFCLHLGIVIGQLNSTRDTPAERKLQGPLLILEIPLLLEMFGAGTAVAEGGAVAAGVAAEGGAAAAGAAGAAGAAAAAEGAFTVASLAGVTMSLVEGAFFAVEPEALAIVKTLVETNAAGEITALTTVGKTVAQAMVANEALAVCSGVIADMGDVFSKGTLVATEDATPLAKKFVDGGGKILQGAKIQQRAAMGAAKNIQESEEKTSAFLSWAMHGMKHGFVGPKTKSAIKFAMTKSSTINKFALVRGTIMGSPHSNVRHKVHLWLLGPAVMGMAAMAMGVVRHYTQRSRSHTDEDMQPLRKP